MLLPRVTNPPPQLGRYAPMCYITYALKRQDCVGLRIFASWTNKFYLFFYMKKTLLTLCGLLLFVANAMADLPFRLYRYDGFKTHKIDNQSIVFLGNMYHQYAWMVGGFWQSTHCQLWRKWCRISHYVTTSGGSLGRTSRQDILHDGDKWLRHRRYERSRLCG